MPHRHVRCGPRHGPHRPCGPGAGAVVAAVTAGAVAGAVIAAHQRPARVHYRYERVIVVQNGSQRWVTLVCPAGLRPGMYIEIVVEGKPFFVQVPSHVREGTQFQVKVPAREPTSFAIQAPFIPAAAIVSDNHGKWYRKRYETLRAAEVAWSYLSPLYASVLFIQTRSGPFSAFKEYGTSSAVDNIKQRFHKEFVAELFPGSLPVVAATAADVHQPAVQAIPANTTAPPPAYENGQSAPPAYQGGQSAPPAYQGGQSAPPAYQGGQSAPPAYQGGQSAPPAYQGGQSAPPAYQGGQSAPPAYQGGQSAPPAYYEPSNQSGHQQQPPPIVEAIMPPSAPPAYDNSSEKYSPTITPSAPPPPAYGD